MLWGLARLRMAGRDRRAVTTVEYALFSALVAVLIVNGAAHLGNDIGATLNRVASEL